MNKIAVLIFTFLLLLSCKKRYEPRTISSVKILEFEKPHTSIRAIQVVDAKNVFYAGSQGDVGFTTDNGILWNALNIRYKDTIIPHFRSIAFNGAAYFALSIANPALLYKISKGKSTLVYTETHKNVFYDAITFFEDNLHGISVGDPTEDCPSILLTRNGGNSWAKVPCNKLPKFEKGEAFFAASNTNIKTIGNTVWIASGGKKSRILKSEDFGKTWQVYTTPIISGKASQGIYSVDFADKNNGIIIGGDYANPLENIANKAITKDGGKTWKIVADQQNPNYKSCIQYVPQTNGKEIFAVGKTGISFSNDGGHTWKEISKEAYYSIQFVNKNTAWLSGNNKIGKLVF